MVLRKAPRLLRYASTLRIMLAKAHKVLLCSSRGSMALIKALKQSQL